MTADARVTAWLDEIEQLLPEARRGFMEDRAPEAAGFLVDATPALLALARGVATLRDDLRRDSDRYLGRVARGSYDDGVTRAYDHIADKLSRLLADAAPDTGEETA